MEHDSSFTDFPYSVYDKQGTAQFGASVQAQKEQSRSNILKTIAEETLSAQK